MRFIKLTLFLINFSLIDAGLVNYAKIICLKGKQYSNLIEYTFKIHKSRNAYFNEYFNFHKIDEKEKENQRKLIFSLLEIYKKQWKLAHRRHDFLQRKMDNLNETK